MTTGAAAPMTEAQFLALPESMQKTELIDGDVFVAPSPTSSHQTVLGALYVRLLDWCSGHPPAYCGLSPFDIRIGPGRVVQPDLFVLLGGLKQHDVLPDAVPDLVIEVLSSRPSRDRVLKRRVYEEAGVGEYWMVDLKHQRFDVVREGRLTQHTDVVTSSVCEGLTVDIRALLSR